jgi:S-adenosylmethionine hydrolase
MPPPIIALLTDFGLTDPFVGIMKGVVLARCPEATFIDLTHGVAAQAVEEGAFWLERSVEWLPRGSIVVAVVDPGVGTERRPLVLEALGRSFVGPDNGLLGPVAARDPASVAYVIEPDRLGLDVRSQTFHGRDVFAPVAAELAAGRLSPSGVGPRAAGFQAKPLPRATTKGTVVTGTVVTVDRFGNLLTSIERGLVPAGPAVVEIGGARTVVRSTYGEASPGELVALVNAFDVLEVAVRDGDAARSLRVGKGAEVVLRPTTSRRG